jgi:hypothetical protein
MHLHANGVILKKEKKMFKEGLMRTLSTGVAEHVR